MDDRRFDTLTKHLAAGMNRRTAIKGLLGLGGAAAVATVLGEPAQIEAQRRATPTPQQPSCPGGQIPCGTGCCCPDGRNICGSACCQAGIAVCCDGACCTGICTPTEGCVTSPPTSTATNVPTNVPAPTNTTVPTNTAVPTNTSIPTESPTQTIAPSQTATRTPTNSPTPSVTLSPTVPPPPTGTATSGQPSITVSSSRSTICRVDVVIANFEPNRHYLGVVTQDWLFTKPIEFDTDEVGGAETYLAFPLTSQIPLTVVIVIPHPSGQVRARFRLHNCQLTLMPFLPGR